MTTGDVPPIQIPVGQLMRMGSRVLTYKGRAFDPRKHHVFIDTEGVPFSLTDKDLLAAHTAEEIRPISPDEAERLQTGKPNRNLELASAEDLVELTRQHAYIRAWKDANRPPRSEKGLALVIHEGAARLRDDRPPNWRTLARWLDLWLLAGEKIEGLLRGKGGNTSDRFAPIVRDTMRDLIHDLYLVDTRPSAHSVWKSVKSHFEEHNVALARAEWLHVPSYEAVLAEIRKIDLYTLECCRVGPRSAAQKHRPVASGPVTEKHN